MRMSQEQKDTWLEALRSGKYEQGGGALFTGGKYCCLGVMQKVLDPDGKVERLGLPSPAWCADNGIEIDGIHGDAVEDEDMDTLARKNDGNKKPFMYKEDGITPIYETEPESFAEIADWIEKNIEVL